MKKNLILCSFLLLWCVSAAFAQIQTPPKFRIVTGFERVDYLIGDKKVTASQVQLHLYQNNIEAAVLWKKSRHQAYNGLYCGILGFAGAVAAVYAPSRTGRIAGGAVAVTGFSGATICAIGSKMKKKRARDMYNTQYGY